MLFQCRVDRGFSVGVEGGVELKEVLGTQAKIREPKENVKPKTTRNGKGYRSKKRGGGCSFQREKEPRKKDSK